jgi:hypothetical protein
MMQSAEEHQDIPSEDVAVMPVKGLRKKRRVLNLAADSRQKWKNGTRRNCGSKRKSDVAYRKVPHCAIVARCKRNVFRKIWAEVNCGSRSTLATAGRRMTCHVKVAWLKGERILYQTRRGRRYPERLEFREETSAETEMQQEHKETRC